MKQISNNCSKTNNWLKQHGKPMRRKSAYKDLKTLKSGVIVGTCSYGKSFAEKCYDLKKLSDEDIITLVDVLMRETQPLNTPPAEKDELEATLLKALCLYVKKEYDEDKQNFSSVIKLLKYAYENEDEGLDVIMNDFKERNPNHIALEYYNMFKNNCGKGMKGVVISCAIRLSPIRVLSTKK